MNLLSNESYISRRSPVLSAKGMVASSQPLATMAGVEILQKGGTAADAAVAVAAALNVTQPGSTGLGGDCFVLYYRASDKKILALNGSGRSPSKLTLNLVEKEGHSKGLPVTHPHTVTVPGAPAAWYDVQDTLGNLTLAQVLAPAVKLAEEGYPVAPLTALWWQGGADNILSKHRFGKELMIEGRGPQPGEYVRLPNLAHSLRMLAEKGKEPFYEGEIAEGIVAAVQEEGGVMSIEDLAAHSSEWVEPISIDYRGFKVWECPPNGHGLAALIALNIAQCFDMNKFPAGSPERYHLLIECMRLAFADTAWHVADPHFYQPPLAELLSDEYAGERSKLIDLNAANTDVRRGTTGKTRALAQPDKTSPDAARAGGDTVYFAVTDGEGNGCSFINSTFHHFGSGIVPERCGYSLQNRGLCFTFDSGHPNSLEPGKRPYNTIIPGLITNAATNDLFAVFGVMGGMMQPQGHLQVATALLEDELDPQAALDRGRFQLEDGKASGAVLVEDSIDSSIIEGLKKKDQALRVISGLQRPVFGLGQIIYRTEHGVLWGGSDPRGDGCAIGLP